MWRVIVMLAVLASIDRPAYACTPLTNPIFVVEDDPSDTSQPSAPTVERVYIARFGRVSDIGCPAAVLMTINVVARDDRTPTTELGYQVVGISARPVVVDDRIRKVLGEQLSMAFAYDTPSFDADFELRAFDLAGNMGPATTFHVSYVKPPEDDGGCSTTRSPSSFILIALALLYARRHARAAA